MGEQSMHWAEGFIAVDWGTTNRRAYLIDASGKRTNEFEDHKGVLSVWVKTSPWMQELRAMKVQVIADTGYPKFFDADLDLVHDAFEVWRYIHEKGHVVDTDLGFLQRFSAAVQKALAGFP